MAGGGDSNVAGIRAAIDLGDVHTSSTPLVGVLSVERNSGLFALNPGSSAVFTDGICRRS